MDSHHSRPYEQSHPWLTFSFDASRFPHDLWMLLGAAQSKCKHIEGVALDTDHAKNMYEIYLVKGAHSTTAIEGNTLSEEEVRAIVNQRSQIPPSMQYQEQEVKNVVLACEHIANTSILSDPPPLTSKEICNLNKMVLENVPVGEDVVRGEIRKHSVTVNRYLGAPACDCEYLLDRLCETLNNKFDLGKQWPYATGILKAIIAHLYLVWIHPFGDGNGRTARLVELKLCADAGIAKPACHVLSNFYNKTRDKYYRELDAASKKQDITDFIMYALSGMIEMLDEQIAYIRDCQLRYTWENTVHHLIRGNTPTAERRRFVALDLYDVPGMLEKSAMRNISTRLAAAYAGSYGRKLSRDLAALKEYGLVVIEGKQVRANKDKVLAWLPPRRHTEEKG